MAGPGVNAWDINQTPMPLSPTQSQKRLHLAAETAESRKMETPTAHEPTHTPCPIQTEGRQSSPSANDIRAQCYPNLITPHFPGVTQSTIRAEVFVLQIPNQMRSPAIPPILIDRGPSWTVGGTVRCLVEFLLFPLCSPVIGNIGLAPGPHLSAWGN